MVTKKLLACLANEEYIKEIKDEDKQKIKAALIDCYGEAQSLVGNVEQRTEKGLIPIKYDFYSTDTTHSYRSISEFLKQDKSSFEYLVEIIPNVIKMFPAYGKKLAELSDYISAENLRLARENKLKNLIFQSYRKMNQNIEELQAEFETKLETTATKKITNINENIKKVKETQDGIQSRFVSIVGMFSSVIFALFGGLNMLSAVVTGIQSVKNTSQILLLISMLCFLFMSLYTLVIVILFFIGRVASIDGSLFPKVSFGSLFSRAPFLRGSVLSLSKTIIIILMVISVITFSGSIWWSKPVTASKNEQILQRCLDYDLKKINEIILRSDNEKATSTNNDAAIEKICAKYEREKTEEKAKLSANEKEIKKT